MGISVLENFLQFKGLIYYTDDNEITALDSKTGTKKWTTVSKYYSAGPTVANGLVYTSGEKNNKLSAFNSKTGAAKWEFTTTFSYAGITVIDKNGVAYYPSTSAMVQ